jgi:DNA repair photolyase
MDYYKGRGAQLNTQNPFSKTQLTDEHIEGLDEALELGGQTQIFYENPKKVINVIESPDLYAMNSMNPYQGCEHGCIYCYARNSHQYWGFSAGMDFESKIVVKQNAAHILEKEFLKKSWKPSPIALSGNTDCYQPLERKLKITRSLLKIFVKYANPVSIITKNSLVVRDLDLLTELAQQNLLHVYISLTTLDESLRQKLEPRTASAASRLKTIRTLTEAGIPVGVMTAPLIPGLNDQEIPALLQAAAENGAVSAGYTVVRLNGSVKDLFQDWLYKNFPDRATKVWNLICELHGGQVNDSQFGRRMRGEGQVAEMISQLFKISKRKHFANREMPAYDFSHFRPGGNYSLF